MLDEYQKMIKDAMKRVCFSDCVDVGDDDDIAVSWDLCQEFFRWCQ